MKKEIQRVESAPISDEVHQHIRNLEYGFDLFDAAVDVAAEMGQPHQVAIEAYLASFALRRSRLEAEDGIAA